ncbi:hypothetical protein [Tritonibacter scottomollicae]|uniref:hypothetical protein n=1 Tax=Tritonibacter scottomollicae TaxID=483013 RepID=UPI001A9E9853|nr:hypothetical protein [Tritonibacter scottomollicae]
MPDAGRSASAPSGAFGFDEDTDFVFGATDASAFGAGLAATGFRAAGFADGAGADLTGAGFAAAAVADAAPLAEDVFAAGAAFRTPDFVALALLRAGALRGAAAFFALGFVVAGAVTSAGAVWDGAASVAEACLEDCVAARAETALVTVESEPGSPLIHSCCIFSNACVRCNCRCGASAVRAATDRNIFICRPSA